MADSPLGERPIPAPPTDEPRLESWGEIAAYLRREIRTVQRWERYQGLPVRRLQIGKLGSVYAYRSELDKWYRERQPHAENGEEDAGKAPDAEIAAQITVSADGEKEESKNEPSSSELPPPRPRITRLHITITLLTLLALAVVTPGVYFLRSGHSPVRSASGKIRLVVLPFANLSGDAQQDYFSAGLTDEMITQLGRLDPQRLGVIAADSSKPFASKPITEIGRTLDVQYALEGSVRRGGNEVRINVQLIQVSDQTHIWANSYTGDLRDILHVQDEVAAAVASQIRVALPVGALGVNGAKGTARALNPNDATAHLWYSHYNMMRNHIPVALQENSRTLDLDPVSPLFNTVRAEIYYNSRQYDLAIDQASHTIEQYPTYWLTYIWLGSAYREKKMYAEALQQFSEARKLSSDHPAIMALYGHTLALAGDRAGARRTLADLHLLAQSRYVSSLYSAAVYTRLGDRSTALEWLDKAYKERNDRLLYLNVDPMADPLRSDPRFRDMMKRLHLP